jgi:hypothetical protein
MVVLMLRLKWLAILASLCAVLPCHGGASSDRPIIWGICGHPTWSDYADWVPANSKTVIGYLRKLGCTFYRCSFEGAAYPKILNSVVPIAQAAGVTILPDLPLNIVAQEDEKTNFERNYQIGYDWASYAISQHYHLPYWELGNELENGNLVSVSADGTAPDQFPDKVPGGFFAIASSLNGAYHGIHDAYAAGRDQGETKIEPKILYGACYRHWGLLTKIENHNGSLPCDIISWHWYEPNCGLFNAPIQDSNSFSKNRSPAECLADFKSQSDPSKPMDVWITELNRSVHTPAGYDNGSVAETPTGQDWTAEAQEIQLTIDDLKKAPTVKAMFVYELFDEPRADGSNPVRMRSEGNFGLMTGLNGRYKDAFKIYQNEIKENP